MFLGYIDQSQAARRCMPTGRQLRWFRVDSSGLVRIRKDALRLWFFGYCPSSFTVEGGWRSGIWDVLES